MSKSTAQAPGCFGAASVHSTDSVHCQACPAYAECGEESIRTLEAIKTQIDVRDLLARHKNARQKATMVIAAPAPRPPEAPPIHQPKPIEAPVARKTPVAKVAHEPSPEDQARLEKLRGSVKAHAQAAILCRQDKFSQMRAELPKQRNPFATSGPQYLRVACDLLLSGGFTKAGLKHAFMNEFDWGDATAASHVPIVCAVFLVFEISVFADSKFVLNPALA